MAYATNEPNESGMHYLNMHMHLWKKNIGKCDNVEIFSGFDLEMALTLN